jgi:hypothetical protein
MQKKLNLTEQEFYSLPLVVQYMTAMGIIDITNKKSNSWAMVNSRFHQTEKHPARFFYKPVTTLMNGAD